MYASGRLYQMGGITYNGGILDGVKVFSAPASDTGAVGAWTAQPNLPEAVYYHTSATVNGFVYVLGGFHYTDAAGVVVSNVVYRAKVNADGTLGAWQTDTSLPQPVFFPSAAAWNGRVYVTGGWNGSALISSVYSAQVNADGSLGPWVAQKSLPQAVYTHAAVSNGTLYVLGGTVNGGADIQNTVYFASINPDGTLADWAATSPLPSPVSNHGAVVANGQVFVLGGWDGAKPLADVDSSLVAPNGSLAPWNAETPLPRALYLHATAVSASQIFVTGGIDPSAIRAEVYSMPLPPPPGPADFLPPRTALAFIGPRFGGMPFISTATAVSLSAVDDAKVVGDGAGVGVAATQISVDGAPFAPYTAPITVHTDGGHLFEFLSTDRLGHVETVRTATAAVDGTAPVTSLSVGAPSAVLTTGETIVGPATQLAVSAGDPVVNGAASGVALALAGVDGGALAASTAPFVLPAVDGAHTVSMRAYDNVGNAEDVHAATVYRDGAAPVTALSFSSVPFAGPSGPIYGASAALAFSAIDPASGGVAAGVNRTEYSFDAGAWTAYNGAFGAPEGPHSVAYRSIDNVGNVEASKTAAFAVDATAPRTTLTVDGGTTLFGADLLTAMSSLSLAAADPISNGTASGVARVVYSVDGGPDQIYASPFHLTPGAHIVVFGAVDNAGNAETRQSASLAVGTFLADALAALDSVTLSGGATVAGSIRTNGAFEANGRATVAGDVAAMSATLTGQSSVTGTVTRGAATLSVASYDLAAAAADARASNNDAALPAGTLSGGALTLSQGALALPAGDYYLTGLTLSGHAALTVTGRVNIFLRGSLSVTGGASLNGAGDANNLWIVADAGDAALSGQSRSAFNLYAPLSNAAVSGGGAFAGRLLAKAVSLSGGALQPSTSILPPSGHGGGAAEHSPRPVTRDDGGTRGGGHAGGSDSAVASSRLDDAAPDVVRSTGAAPAVAAVGTPPAFAGGVPAAHIAHSHMPSFPLAPRAAFSAVAADGGAVRAGDRTAVVIPAGATDGLGVTVAPAKPDVIEAKRQSDVQASKGLIAAAAGVQYGPEGAHFAKPVTLEMPYDRARLPAGVAENDLAIHYWNPVTGDWEKLASSVDTQNQIVRAQTSHFSLYQLFGGGAPASVGGAADVFGLRAAYAFPNPVRGASQATIRIQPGVADSVEVNIYDVTGRKVHSSSAFALTSTNDGNGLGLQDTYDHVWDVSGVGSGVYTYVITAKKAGAADIHKSGRLGVVK